MCFNVNSIYAEIPNNNPIKPERDWVDINKNTKKIVDIMLISLDDRDFLILLKEKEIKIAKTRNRE